MPIRDVEAYGPITRDDVRFLSNRGTNGIDGVISTALGVRAPYNCDRVIVFTGDLALLYDSARLQLDAAARDSADDRLRGQRRRRDLQLPAGRRARRTFRGAVATPPRWTSRRWSRRMGSTTRLRATRNRWLPPSSGRIRPPEDRSRRQQAGARPRRGSRCWNRSRPRWPRPARFTDR